MPKRVLVVSPVPTHPAIAGNRVAILSLVHTLDALGHETHLLFTDHEQGDVEAMRAIWGGRFHHAPYRWPRRTPLHYLRRMRYLFREGFRGLHPVDAWYDPALDPVLRELHARFRFDAVIVEYIFWSKALDVFPAGVLKIVETHDIFSDRHLLYRRRGLDYGWFSTTPEEEAKALARAQVVVALSEEEAVHFRRLAARRVVTAGRLGPALPPRTAPGAAGRMLFVASDTSINVDGLGHFLESVYPAVKAAVPDAEIHVAGGVGRHFAGREGCVILGVVDDLTPVYASARMAVNPVRFSTGLSIKSIEALGYAMPLVTTTAGAAGLAGKLGPAAIVADDDREFAGAVVRLLKDDAAVAGMSRAAHAFSLAWNRECIASLAALIESGPPP